MAWSKRSKLSCALGMVAVVAIACGGDDGGKTSDAGSTPSGATPAAGVVGKTCRADTDCGAGSICKQSQGFGTLSALLSLIGAMDLPAPGGYCSAVCMADANCGSGSVCLGAAFGITQGECRKSCTSSSECREGYECAQQAELPADSGVPSAIAALRLPSQCQAKPKPDVLTAGQAGAACQNPTDGGVAAECGDGFCVGGACSGVCSDDSTCGAGAACIPNGFYGSAGACQQTCSVDTDCRRYKANSNVGCVEANMRKVCGTKVYPLAPNSAGKACAADAECGTTGTCLEAIGLRQTPAPGGYCSQLGCQDDTVCGGGSCVAGTCYAGCTTDASCRTGYSCQSVRVGANANASVCAPAPATTGDAGTKPPVDAGVAVVADAG